MSRACPSKTARPSEQVREGGRAVLSRACPSKTARPTDRTPADRTEPLCQPGWLGLPSLPNREAPRHLALMLVAMRLLFNYLLAFRLCDLRYCPSQKSVLIYTKYFFIWAGYYCPIIAKQLGFYGTFVLRLAKSYLEVYNR